MIPTDVTPTLNDLTALGVPVPKSITEAVAQLEAAVTAAAEIDLTPQPPAPEVLLAKDAAQQINAYAAARAAADIARTTVRELSDALRARPARALAAHTPELLESLNDWFIDHLDDLAREGSPNLHPARAEALTTQRETFERLHANLLGGWAKAQYKGALFDGAEWFIHFTLDGDTYNALVAATGPAYALRIHAGQHNHYGVARALGATPNLARDWRDVAARFAEAHREAQYATDREAERRSPDHLLAAAAAEGWARVR